MLPQPPDCYRGPFPPHDPRLPLITDAHETFENHVRKFDAQRAPLQAIHQERVGLIGGEDGGMHRGAPVTMDFHTANGGSDDDESVYSMFQKGHKRYDIYPTNPFRPILPIEERRPSARTFASNASETGAAADSREPCSSSGRARQSARQSATQSAGFEKKHKTADSKRTLAE